jgi:chromate transporter
VTDRPRGKVSLRRELTTLALLFLRLGATAFGGPAAHIAMMEEEVVRRRRWLSRERFLDLLGATNLIPGPNSTEMAIHIGNLRAGVPGLIVAGSCFIAPAALIVGAIAWAYVRFGKLPAAVGLLYGVKPVVIVVIGQAIWLLARTAVKSVWLATIGLAAAAAILLGTHELVVLGGAGLLAATVARARWPRQPGASVLLVAPAAATAATASLGLSSLFLAFLKIGSVLFGSGYVLIAFLRADLVTRWHWLTESQLLDAVAVGQVTPGPVFTTATFIGYILAGAKGATVATLGIFLPAFVFVAASGPLVPRLRRSPFAGAILDGVNLASLAMMAVVAWQLAQGAIVDVPTAVILVASAALLLLAGVNSVWLILGGALVGLAKSFMS